MEQRKLFLDIETIPAGTESHGALKILHSKKKDKEKDFEQFLLGTSFDGAFGRILCIGYANDDEPTQVIYENGDEKVILQKFWDIARYADLFIGHNVMDFDLRFIFQRSIVLGVKPPQNLINLPFARYRNNPIFDTMREWVKWANLNVGLEHIALALGIPTPKDGIDGSQVWSFYQKGKIDDILEYCQRDVETARAVYKKMVFEK